MVKLKAPLLSLGLVLLILSLVASTFIQANGFQPASPIYTFLVLMILLVSLPLWRWLAYLLQLVSLAYTCYTYYHYNLSFSFKWFNVFLKDILGYFNPARQGEYAYFPENLALLLMLSLFLLLINVTIEYHHWQVLLLFALAYPVTLMIVNGTELSGVMMLLAISGVVLVYTLKRAQQPLQESWRRDLLSVLLLGTVAFLAWQRPVLIPSFSRGMAEFNQGLTRRIKESHWFRTFIAEQPGAPATLGFSETSTQLGGPVSTNETIAFEVIASKPHLWQVATADFYTGRGWTVSAAEQTGQAVASPFTANTWEGQTTTETEEIEILLRDERSFIPQPSGVNELSYRDDLAEELTLTYAPEQLRFFLALGSEAPNEAKFTLNHAAPTYQQTDLQYARAYYPGPGAERYLQVGETLGAVAQLALEVTAGAETDYEKAKSLEAFFQEDPRFQYSLSESRVAPAGADFVQTFLFDYSIGYCEHFSSAMVVMARTLGLPTRWVKGFTGGKAVEELPDGRQRFVIQSKNAHAWPEIYFEAIGWVPFEPTKSYAVTGTAGTPEQRPVTPVTPAESTPTPAQTAATSASSTVATTTSKAATAKESKVPTLKDKQAQVGNPALWLGGGGLVAALLWVAFLWSQQLKWAWLLLKVRWGSPQHFTRRFQELLVLLASVHVRGDNQTLAEYGQELIELEPRWEESLATLFQLASADYYQADPPQRVKADYLSAFEEVRPVALALTEKADSGRASKEQSLK